MLKEKWLMTHSILPELLVALVRRLLPSDVIEEARGSASIWLTVMQSITLMSFRNVQMQHMEKKGLESNVMTFPLYFLSPTLFTYHKNKFSNFLFLVLLERLSS